MEQRRAFHVSFFMFRIDAQAFLSVVDAESDAHQLQRFISCFEALAIAVAVALFSPLLGDLDCIFPSESDSIVACFGSRRWYSPSAALQWALRVLAETSVFSRVRPLVTHVPGKKNALADAISRYCLEIASANDSQIVRMCSANVRSCSPNLTDILLL